MSLSTRKKRKRELREEYVQQDALIFRLPDETLLSIFKYLTTEELILAAGICKWFRNIAYDEELWTKVDLTSKSYSNIVLAKFFHRFPRDCTEVLKITGAFIHNRTGKPPLYTGQVNSLIRTSFPNLRNLHITQYDFRTNQASVNNITYLPANLHGLYLKRCEMSTKIFPGTLSFLQVPPNFPSNSPLQQLEILSFENSSCLTSEAMSSLPNLCPKLIELNLNGCNRLLPNNTFIHVLLSYGTTLRRLHLSTTPINDDAMHSICRKLKRLNLLDIKRCEQITINIVENLLTLEQLQNLIANDEIERLYTQRKLHRSDSTRQLDN